jgi:hypothetical protein
VIDGLTLYDKRTGERAKTAIQSTVEADTRSETNRILAWLYRWDELLDRELINPILTDKPPLPRPVYALEDLGVRTYGTYHLGLNPVGLEDQITLNIRYAQPSRPEYAVLETVAHEKLHLKQQHQGKHPYKGGSNTHNREFVDMAESIGLHPAPVKGWHLRPASDPFRSVLERLGIGQPQVEPVEKSDKRNYWTVVKPSGRSTLTLWACDCIPPQKARVGKAEFEAICPRCTGSFHKA